MAMNNPRISVIVPVYQHWELTSVLFDALTRQTLPKDEWECLVVDNGSDYVPEPASLPSFVTLLKCEKPGSYSARNKAVNVAKGEILAFTDADCRPSDEWLEKIEAEYKRFPGKDYLLAGGVTIRKFEPGALNLVENYEMLLGLPQSEYVKKGYAITANLSIPAEIFKKVGLFDEERFSGGDVEFCLRAKSVGIPLKYLPAANVDHPPRKEMSELKNKIKRVKGAHVLKGTMKSRAIYITKTLAPPMNKLMRVLKSKDASLMQKMKGVSFILLLRFYEVAIMFQLLVNKKMERR